MVDIDNLKTINDRYGHVHGNEIIREVGQRLARALPMAKSICRYGGDEFFALVPLDKKTAIERAERVLILLEDLPQEIPCKVYVSIGIATFSEDGDVADDFMDAADRAMYVAKGEGGHQIHSAGVGEGSSGRVYQAMIAVNARRLIPGEDNALRHVLDSMLREEEQELDSAAVQQSLRALMEAVESKDSYTREHSLEVSELTRRLCQAVGLSEREASP
jgi:diguanylate cyclase (GGDEF)-like protein